MKRDNNTLKKRIIVARIMDRYQGPSDYYLYERMLMLDSERYETICIYLRRMSDVPNNQEKDFRCFYLADNSKIGGINILLIRKLARVLKNEKVDIIHAVRHGATVYGTISGALVGTPVLISHVHGLNRCRNLRRKFLYKLLSPKITRMIGCSEGVREDIAKNYPGINEKAVSLPNSINYAKYHDAECDPVAMRKELGLPQDAFVFTLVGRLVPTKGHDLLIDAFAKLKSERAHLLLVGDGVLEDAIREQAQSLGVADRVCFAGFRNDVPAILKACDAFALSSIREGMPLCVFEAMAAGLPVIGTGAGGTCELLESGNLGFYIAERNPEAFAEGMQDILDLSPEERQDLIGKADKKVHSVYNHEHAVKCLQEIYESALKDRGVT